MAPFAIIACLNIPQIPHCRRRRDWLSHYCVIKTFLVVTAHLSAHFRFPLNCGEKCHQTGIITGPSRTIGAPGGLIVHKLPPFIRLNPSLRGAACSDMGDLNGQPVWLDNKQLPFLHTPAWNQALTSTCRTITGRGALHRSAVWKEAWWSVGPESLDNSSLQNSSCDLWP